MGTVANLAVKIGANATDFNREIAGLGKSVEGVGPKLRAAAGALGAGFAAMNLGNEITQVATYASHIDDLAKKSGITASAVQELDFVAKQSGSSFDTISTAMALMGNRLVEGDKSIVSSLKYLGLSFEGLRSQSPDKAFEAIGAAIAKVPDPMERSKIALDLFGKSGANLLPVLTSNIGALRDKARDLGLVMNDELVAAGDDLDDRFAQLQTRMQVMKAEALVPLMEGFMGLPPAMQTAGTLALDMAPTIGGLGLAFAGLTPMVTGLGAAVGITGLAASFGAAAAAIATFWAAWEVGSLIDTSFTIGGLAPSEWVTFLATWRFGLSDIDAETAKLSITSARLNDELAAMRGPNPRTGDISLDGKPSGGRGGLGTDPDAIAAAKAYQAWMKQQQKANERLYSEARNDAGMAVFALDAQVHKLATSAQLAVPALGLLNQQFAALKAQNTGLILTRNEFGRSERGTTSIEELQKAGMNLPSIEDNKPTQQTFVQELSTAQQAVVDFGNDLSSNLSYAFTEVITGAQSLKEGLKGIWQGIKNSLSNIFQGVLDNVIKSALFGGQGGGGLLGGLLGKLSGGLFGGMGGGGSNVGVSTITGLGGKGGGLAGLMNPWTLGIGGAIGLGAAIWKGGLFRGGEEALHVNPARDQLMSQFGDASIKGIGGGNHNLASLLTRITGEDSGGAIFRALSSADTRDEFLGASQKLWTQLDKAGLTDETGGFIGMSNALAKLDAATPAGPPGMDSVEEKTAETEAEKGELTLRLVCDPDTLAHLVLDGVESGGELFNRWRILLNQGQQAATA